MKQTAIEWLIEQVKSKGWQDKFIWHKEEVFQQAKEMEKKQLFLASNISAKDAYKAGQASMYCGCYEYDGCTTYEEWLYKNFKSEEDD